MCVIDYTKRGIRTRKAERTLLRLLQAATDVFSEKGYYETSVSEICQRARMVPGSFYYYFRNKRDVFSELVAKLIEKAEQRVTNVVPAAGEGPTTRAFRELLFYYCDNPSIYNLIHDAEFVAPELLRLFYDRVAHVFIDHLCDEIATGTVRRLNPQVIAYCLLGIAEFVAMRWGVWESRLSKSVSDSITDFVLHGIDAGAYDPPETLRKSLSKRRVRHISVTGGNDTPRRILTAAEKELGTRGFYDASIADITRQAGVAQGTFYVYYESKLQMFSQLIREIGDVLRAEMREATVGLQDRREVEEAGFRASLSFIRQHPHIYRIIREAWVVDRQAQREYYQELVEGYVRGLRKGMDDGQIRSMPPEPVAYGLVGIGHLIGQKWIVWGKTKNVPERVFAEMMRFIMCGIRGRAG